MTITLMSLTQMLLLMATMMTMMLTLMSTIIHIIGRMIIQTHVSCTLVALMPCTLWLCTSLAPAKRIVSGIAVTRRINVICDVTCCDVPCVRNCGGAGPQGRSAAGLSAPLFHQLTDWQLVN